MEDEIDPKLTEETEILSMELIRYVRITLRIQGKIVIKTKEVGRASVINPESGRITKVLPVEEEQIVKGYKAGESMDSLGQRYSVSHTEIARILDKNNVPRRSRGRGGQNQARRLKESARTSRLQTHQEVEAERKIGSGDKIRDIVLTRYREGKTIDEIAKETGVMAGIIKNVISAFGDAAAGNSEIGSQ